ncbi:putative neprosin [Medicago truncatula]|uniref:Putative neprosin n=1 Tax=Medicago truncatula TaxID=3880 RepID=A0A396GM99_MEDTR|nr:putative neprosin [Medicago truncatula]
MKVSPDGDIIDCVLTHKQPAFDHPLLKGTKPLDPPKRPRADNQIDNMSDIFQLWSLSGESCPEGTIPIRRVTEQDLLRANSISKFGSKLVDGVYREYAYGSVNGDGYTGAKANLNVWSPKTENKDEYSLAKISLSSQSGETVEVYENLYKDRLSRLFIYWTADKDGKTGCYNLLCSGFIQTNRKIVIGGTLTASAINRNQFDVALKIWKDPFVANWWLEYGSGNVVGYWPSRLFNELKGEAYFAQFGGEVLNLMRSGSHTTTQMGSGNFQSLGYRKSAYIRNMQVSVNVKNTWIDLPDPNYAALRPKCYSIRGAYSKKWGNYLYYGGPGHNDNCPL